MQLLFRGAYFLPVLAFSIYKKMKNIDVDKLTEKAVLNLAKICYKTIRAYDKAITAYGPIHAWTVATKTDIEAYMKMVSYAMIKTDCTPRDLHAIWHNHMVVEGWNYGMVINEIEKTHPDLTTFTFLPEASRAKYAILTGLITSVAQEEVKNDWYT